MSQNLSSAAVVIGASRVRIREVRFLIRLEFLPGASFLVEFCLILASESLRSLI